MGFSFLLLYVEKITECERSCMFCIVGNGQILQWDLMSKINICGVETKSMIILYIRPALTEGDQLMTSPPF